MSEQLKEFKVYQSKGKQLGLVFLGLLMTLLGGFVFMIGLMDKKVVFMLVGVIALVFFGICEWYIIKQFIVGKELVVLTADGFYDYSSGLSSKNQLIAWQDVKEIKIQSMAGQVFVCIYLNDPTEFLGAMGTLKRKATQANIKLGYGEITINLQSAKGCTNEELVAEMEKFLS